MGKLIVIEGLDGSGKGTQTKMLLNALERRKISTLQLSYPNYASPSAALVKMYLAGEFGKSPADVNAYAASSFYAVDRFANFKTQWEREYQGDMLIISDRYTTSNIVFQLGKLPQSQRDAYIAWLEDFEYGKLGLPKPDLVLFLDMPVEVSQRLITARYGGDESKKDIHEKDTEFLMQCRENARYAAQKLGWKIIGCAKENRPMPVEDIHEMLMNAVLEVAGKE